MTRIYTWEPTFYPPGYWAVTEEIKRIGDETSFVFLGPFERRSDAAAIRTPFEWILQFDGQEVKTLSKDRELSLNKAWKFYPEDCEHCGGGLEVLSMNRFGMWVNDDDLVRCTSCYCLGYIDVGSSSYDVSVFWPEEPCAKCHRKME